MKRTGRKRRERKAQRAEAAKTPPGVSAELLMPTETGLTQIHDARLTQMAIKRGWIKGQRWSTDATVADLQKAQRERELTIRERTLLAVLSGLNNDDQRIRQIAVKSVLLMESQNQRDEAGPSTVPQQGATTVNVGIMQHDHSTGRPDVFALIAESRAKRSVIETS